VLRCQRIRERRGGTPKSQRSYSREQLVSKPY